MTLVPWREPLSRSGLNSLTPQPRRPQQTPDGTVWPLSVFTTATRSHANLCESVCVQPLLISLMDLTGLNQVSCHLKLYCCLLGNPLSSLPSAVRGQEFVHQGRLLGSGGGSRVLLGDSLVWGGGGYVTASRCQNTGGTTCDLNSKQTEKPR